MIFHGYEVLDRILDIPLTTGEGLQFRLGSYRTRKFDRIIEHALVYCGNFQSHQSPLLVRINSACFTSDIFGCHRCDCNLQLKKTMELIANEGEGLIIYHFHHEGRGVGFHDKLKSYHLMDTQELSTHDAFVEMNMPVDSRRYMSSALILRDLGIQSIRLISNNPHKRQQLESYGVRVQSMVNLIVNEPHLESYLLSKQRQFGHNIQLPFPQQHH